MDVRADLADLLATLPFEHALCDGCYGWVMSVLDILENLDELLAVLVNLGRERRGSGLAEYWTRGHSLSLGLPLVGLDSVT